MTLTDSTAPTPSPPTASPPTACAEGTPCADGSGGWSEICPVGRLTPDRGVAALVGGEAIAVFLLSSGEIFAVSNVEPFTGASVLSRGLVGDLDGIPTVASPLHKQRFDLRNGRCLDVSDVAIRTYPARVVGGRVHVSTESQPATVSLSASGPTSR